MKNTNQYLKAYYGWIMSHGKIPIQSFVKWVSLLIGKLMDSMNNISRDSTAPSAIDRIPNTGWARLPNCREFRIIVKEWNPILSLENLYKRVRPEIKIKTARLRKANRYMEHQIKRLEKAKDNPTLYWTISLSLMQRSNVFRTSAWRRVYPNWHRLYSWVFVLKTNRKVSQIMNGLSIPAMTSRRTYIDKPNGKLRPLGAPTPEYRIFLHMLSNFLEMWLRPYVPGQNHAYTVGKGTMTAWQAIIKEKVLDAKYVYETDLKGFFDNVQHWAIRHALRKTKMPAGMIALIMELNSVWPSPPKRDREDQKKTTLKKMRAWKEELSERSPLTKSAEQLAAMAQNGRLTLEPRRRTQGVAQGSSISGLLAIITLARFLSPPTQPEVKSISYADDPIFYSDTPFEIQDQPIAGIYENKEKGRWLKKDGKWVVDNFTYLGLNYDVTEDRIRGHTRKGSELELSKRMIKISELWDLLQSPNATQKVQRALDIVFRDYNKPSRSGYNWRNTLTGRLSGLMMARIYSGSWELNNIEQDFNFEWIRSSLVGQAAWEQYSAKLYPDQVLYRAWDTFSSSTLAAHIMLEVMRSQRYRLTKRYPSFARKILELPDTYTGSLELDNGRAVGPNRELIEAALNRKKNLNPTNNAPGEVLLLG